MLNVKPYSLSLSRILTEYLVDVSPSLSYLVLFTSHLDLNCPLYLVYCLLEEGIQDSLEGLPGRSTDSMTARYPSTRADISLNPGSHLGNHTPAPSATTPSFRQATLLPLDIPLIRNKQCSVPQHNIAKSSRGETCILRKC